MGGPCAVNFVHPCGSVCWLVAIELESWEKTPILAVSCRTDPASKNHASWIFKLRMHQDSGQVCERIICFMFCASSGGSAPCTIVVLRVCHGLIERVSPVFSPYTGSAYSCGWDGHTIASYYAATRRSLAYYCAQFTYSYAVMLPYYWELIFPMQTATSVPKRLGAASPHFRPCQLPVFACKSAILRRQRHLGSRTAATRGKLRSRRAARFGSMKSRSCCCKVRVQYHAMIWWFCDRRLTASSSSKLNNVARYSVCNASQGQPRQVLALHWSSSA